MTNVQQNIHRTAVYYNHNFHGYFSCNCMYEVCKSQEFLDNNINEFGIRYAFL